MTAKSVSTARRMRGGAVVASVLLAALVGGCGGSDDVSAANRRPTKPITKVHPHPVPSVAPDQAPRDTQPQTTEPQAAEPQAAEQAPEPAPDGPVATEPSLETESETIVTPSPTHGGPVRSHVSLVDNLRYGRGLTVTPSSSVNQPFLSAPGTILDISGSAIGEASLQSYDYQSPEAAAADMAALTGGTGANGQPVSVMWIAPPHFFLRERAFVIYVGSNEAVVNLLADLMGPEVVA